MIYTLPDGYRWDRAPGVTLLDLCLGDRAPFGLIDFLAGAPEVRR
jgi:hypothetical protein